MDDPRTALCVLVPRAAIPPGPPEELPMGRAALDLRREGIRVVFATQAHAGKVSGHEPVPGGWSAVVGVPVRAAYDRYPSQTDPEGFDALLAGLEAIPLSNPPAFTRLCRDKLSCQRSLEASGLALPAIEADPARFAERLDAWGSAFLKPRYGSFGRGVRRVTPGDDLPALADGAVPGTLEPAILQRAVPPPGDWAGVSVRVLVQREPEGGWRAEEGVVRRSREDPVVNVRRGAQAVPASDVLGPEALAALRALCLRAAGALAECEKGDLVSEMGVDAVLDGGGMPHLVEVNGHPRGRLESLACADPARFGRAHRDACARPLRFLAALPLGAGR